MKRTRGNLEEHNVERGNFGEEEQEERRRPRDDDDDDDDAMTCPRVSSFTGSLLRHKSMSG